MYIIIIIIIAASEASNDTIFEGWLAGWMIYPSAISAHSKMAVVVCTAVISVALHLLGQTK